MIQKIYSFDEYEGFINELNDHYGIGAAFARNILFGLSGAEFEIAKQKWGEISESVYHLVRIAEDQSAELYYRSNPRVEMMSIETLFITEFLLLFFSDKKIRTVMNELPFMNITRMESCKQKSSPEMKKVPQILQD